ncbi:pyridoxal phosphate-dependent transferase [Flagelloscypha sp. PMI_526]|nr:pyridoxal phosphate-dependent transferase [Flagelloscypha sp. PMI_526]
MRPCLLSTTTASRVRWSPLRLSPALVRNMTSRSEFKQAPHKLLVIPGPIEVSDDVLFSNAHPSVSHVSPDFIPVLGDAIRLTRDVLLSSVGQPFIISGSGTLGWDQVASNLVEPNENALVLHSGYFGDSFTECLETYGAKVDQLKAPVGQAVGVEEVEKALKAKNYKIITVTHVDTSTAVLSDIQSIAETVRRVSPDTLIIVDAVCSVASEEIQFDQWGLDVVLTASQKGLGTPPGLSILLASPRAIKTFETRKAPPMSYYASWSKWLPIMKAYESGTPAYFATPPTNLIYAFRTSLLDIVKNGSIQERFEKHRKAASRVKDTVKALGLKQVSEEGFEANGMTAVWYPEGKTASDVLPKLGALGIIAAGGLHKDHKDKYFRIGHMGITAVDDQRGDIDKIVDGLKQVFGEK